MSENSDLPNENDMSKDWKIWFDGYNVDSSKCNIGYNRKCQICFDNLTGKALALFNKKLSSHAAVSKRYLQEYQKHFEDSSNSDSESDSQPIKKTGKFLDPKVKTTTKTLENDGCDIYLRRWQHFVSQPNTFHVF